MLLEMAESVTEPSTETLSGGFEWELYLCEMGPAKQVPTASHAGVSRRRSTTK
jgi:hypothetical protein